MYQQIKSFIDSPNPDNHALNYPALLADINALARQAFVDQDQASLLAVHRILYQINLAHLTVSWENPINNVNHPVIAEIKYILESHWENSELQIHREIMPILPSAEHFSHWVKQYVSSHVSNELHPIFIFLRDKATLEQMREFFLQETPLEMLFGDILAMMLPGVYGSIKVEFLGNYWDEVGRANDAKVHRNLRANTMRCLQIPVDCYLQNIELFICEELQLINLYLSLATNRAKHTQLVGVMLATELMIPNRFQYSIDGFRRLGFDDKELTYLIEHTGIDEVHSENWLAHVVLPILKKNEQVMTDIVYGIARRLSSSRAVLDKLCTKIQ